MNISVVIPTWNEAAALPETVSRIRKIPEIVEIIVADGGSGDHTAQIAQQLGCRVVNSPPGRGTQMRHGARLASGDVVLLLHADTWLPTDAGKAIMNCLENKSVVAGGFWKVFQNPHWLMRGSRIKCAIRLYLFGRIMGDQAMFVRREIMEKIGGVPDVPLMEEFELCRLLRQHGKLALADATVETSGRRFRERGVVRTYLRMGRVTLQYYLGSSLRSLKDIYEKP